MKFTTTNQQLKEAFKRLGFAINNKSSVMPVIANILATVVPIEQPKDDEMEGVWYQDAVRFELLYAELNELGDKLKRKGYSHATKP